MFNSTLTRLRLQMGRAPGLRSEMEAALAGPAWSGMQRGRAPSDEAVRLQRVDDDAIPIALHRIHHHPELVDRRLAVRGRDGRPGIPRLVENWTRGSRCLDVEDAIVTSGWDFVQFGHRGLLPGLSRRTEWLMRISDFGGAAPPADLLLGWSEREFFVRSNPVSREFDMAVCLFGHFMNQWGHVTRDLLTRVLGHEEELAANPVLLQEGTPPNFLHMLRHLVPDVRVEMIPVGESVRVQRLIMPMPRKFFPAYWRHDVDVHWPIHGAWGLSDTAFKDLQARLALPADAAREDRIHLSRPRPSNASVLNADRASSLLASFGFRDVTIEDMTFEEARTALARTRVVAASRGSNLVNLLLLAPPGLKVIVYGSAVRRPMRQDFRRVGHDLTHVMGRRRWPSETQRLTYYDLKQLPTTVDLRRLRRTVRRALRRISVHGSGNAIAIKAPKGGDRNQVLPSLRPRWRGIGRG